MISILSMQLANMGDQLFHNFPDNSKFDIIYHPKYITYNVTGKYLDCPAPINLAASIIV